jgi:hypothetical protein
LRTKAATVWDGALGGALELGEAGDGLAFVGGFVEITQGGPLGWVQPGSVAKVIGSLTDLFDQAGQTSRGQLGITTHGL